MLEPNCKTLLITIALPIHAAVFMPVESFAEPDDWTLHSPHPGPSLFPEEVPAAAAEPVFSTIRPAQGDLGPRAPHDFYLLVDNVVPDDMHSSGISLNTLADEACSSDSLSRVPELVGRSLRNKASLRRNRSPHGAGASGLVATV